VKLLSLLLDKGELYTWGFGHRGRLGHSTEVDFDNEEFQNPLIPVFVDRFKPQFVLNMACGGAHTLAIVLDLDQKTTPSPLAQTKESKT
jgi:alpha-tubulin suppressor-like RCC1 family protein